MRVKLSRRARWAVPGTAVAVTAGVLAGLQIPSAQASPDLPAKTPAQLLASLNSDAKLPPLTGTVVERTSLGLPQLPQQDNPTSLSSMLTGSHTVKVYYQDASHFRLAVPEPSAESDVIADGSNVWLWESAGDSVTKFVRSPDAKKPALPADTTPLTPQQAANEVLKAVGKTTLVSVQANVMVADEPAYQLVLAPKDSRSLVGSVVIAVDGKYGVPLRVQVFAKGASSPAFEVGYTAIQFVAPNPANFAFTPPPGATVSVVRVGSHKGGARSGKSVPPGVGTYGGSWLTVVKLPQSDLTQAFGTGAAGSLPANGSPGPSGTGKQPDIYSAKGSGINVSSQEILNALLGSAKPVSGSWGSGTLVSTSLVSILMTGNEVYIGAVKPSVLYAAVGHAS
jgi:outer membrane lipoprotein-sorting protein